MKIELELVVLSALATSASSKEDTTTSTFMRGGGTRGGGGGRTLVLGDLLLTAMMENDNNGGGAELEDSLHYYPNDLGLRFNKIPWIDKENIPSDITLPLTMHSYPLVSDMAVMLQSYTTAHTVMGGVADGDYECQGEDVMEYIQLLGGPPPMPSSNPHAPYWYELCQVVTAQELRRDNTTMALDYWGFLPSLWSNYTLSDVAEAVHRPVLGTHHADLIASFNKAGLQMDSTIVPMRGKRDFIGREIRLMEILNWSIGKVAAVDFWIKWFIGRPRPEEIAWKISTGDLTTQEHGVPESLVHRIVALELQHAENFTAFPEGSPPHPSWPAMHAASSATSLWLPVVANLTSEQYCETLRLDYAIAMARTVAGVHYTEDNFAGLQFGQEFIARYLPSYLEARYGANASAVQAKVETLRFDWKTFNPVDCTFGEEYNHELACTV